MKNVGIVIIGQSNEAGPAAIANGGQVGKYIAGFGYPNNDILADGSKCPSNWRGSPWTVLASRLAAKRNVRAIILNAAVQSTGIVDQWVGRVTTWVPNTYSLGYNEASFVLPTVANGSKFKAGTGGGAQSATTEPTWDPVSGHTTTDNAVTWTALAADANDVPGHIYKAGESGYDPKSYISTAKTRITSLGNNLDSIHAFISGGQQDLLGLYSSPNDRAQAIINLTTDLLNTFPLLNVHIGTTCYWNSGHESDTPPRSYEAVLVPATKLALANFAGNSRVFAGGDLFTGLGKSIKYSTGDSTPVHMSIETCMNSADVWINAMIATGLF